MIVHVVPVKRMPRTLGLLSYTVPEALQAEIRPGQLITMPLRSSIIYGLVFSIELAQGKDELKPIESIVHSVPLCTPHMLRRINTLATLFGVSHGTVATLFTPPLQTRKLSKEAWHTISAVHNTAQSIHATLSTDVDATRASTLYLVPQISDIDHITQSLPKDLRVVVWHSDLSVKEQFARWFLVHRGEYDVVVGTRTALFLPIEHILNTIVWNDHDASHKQWDGHPRYDTRDLVELWGPQFTNNVTYTSYSPRFDTYYRAAKEEIAVDRSFFNSLHSPVAHLDIISMTHERRAGNTELLSGQVHQHITAATGHVVLYVNRKGYATAVGCNDCAYVSRCDYCNMPHVYYASTKTLRCHYCKTTSRPPASCPECHSTEIAPYGIGTEQVESYVRDTFPNMPVIRIDADADITPDIPTSPTIFVGTDKLLSYIPWDNIAIAAIINIDESLNYPDYRAMEAVWHTVKTFHAKLPKQAKLSIQTNNPDHLLFRALKEPERIYRTDLAARKQFSLPPYGVLVRFNYGGITEFAASKEAERVHSMLTRTLTEHNHSATLTYPIATSPTFYRGKYWYTILGKFQRNTWEHELRQCISILPSNWTVDISPQSLLSP